MLYYLLDGDGLYAGPCNYFLYLYDNSGLVSIVLLFRKFIVDFVRLSVMFFIGYIDVIP